MANVNRDINKDNGLPNEVSLGEILNDIVLSPVHAAEFVRNLAYAHLGGAHDALGRKLIAQANAVADPATYGGNAPDASIAEQQRQADAQAAWGANQGQSDVAAAGSVSEPAWMRDARSAGWNAPAMSKPLIDTPPVEPQWMRDARAAGWNSNEQQSAPPPQQSVPTLPSDPNVTVF